MRFLTLILILLGLLLVPAQASAQAVWDNKTYNHPVCNNPNCKMCYGPNGIAAQLAEQRTNYFPAPQATNYTPVPITAQSTTQPTYEIVSVPVVTQVKRCNGITCWYENVTTYRQERRLINSPVSVSTNIPSLLTNTELVPTPYEAVSEMLALANPKKSEVLYDIGCGDGRIVYYASLWFGCRSVGIELNPESAKQAEDRIKSAGLDNLVKIYQGNALKFTYEHADIVTMYLYPELMEKLLPKFKSGTKVISYLHEIQGGQEVNRNGHKFYIWIKP